MVFALTNLVLIGKLLLKKNNKTIHLYIDYRLGLHISLQNLGLIIMIQAVYEIENSFPRRYYSEEPWYSNQYLHFYIFLSIILGLAFFLVNIFIGLTKFFKVKKIASH